MHPRDQRFAIAKNSICGLDLELRFSPTPLLSTTMSSVGTRASSNSCSCSGKHGRSRGEGRNNRSRACRTCTVLACLKPSRSNSSLELLSKKHRQRTSEEAIIFGQPESYWRKILRPVVALPENPRKNHAPEPLST